MDVACNCQGVFTDETEKKHLVGGWDAAGMDLFF